MLATVQRRLLVGLPAVVVLQVLMRYFFVENFVGTLLCYALIMLNMALYANIKEAVAHVIYSEETGTEPSRDKYLFV